MRCSTCGAANPEGNKFCGDCGAALATACPECGLGNPAGKRFCGECGTALTLAASPPVPMPAPESAAPAAERRVCSVLFCDLVGFTPLSEARDPEEVRELLSRYFEVARTVIGRYGGVVEKFIGDAVMAVWGTPTATEEDAERAVRAAIELTDAVTQLGVEAGAVGLAARAGVVTGVVAVSIGATNQGMVAGDAVNTAARVQAAAGAGEVLVDEGTRRVAQAAIDFADGGSHTLKGKAEPVPLWRAVRVLSGVGGAQRIDGLEAPFVGRDPELRLVKELFHACAERKTPRLVSVTGAAGVGKSRLGWEFEKYVDGLASSVYWHRGRCLSYGDGVAFWALAEMVRQRFGIAEEDASVASAGKLTAGVDQWFADPGEREYVRARLAQLLGVDVGEGAPTLPREELFAGWRLFFERLAQAATVVLLVEDLHYADPGLLDFLEHLLDWAQGVPIYVLTLSRPELEERRSRWGTGRRNSTALSMDALDQAAMDTLLDGLVPGMPVSAKTAIAAQAEGIPLYAVETVRMLIDRDIVQPVDGVYRLVDDVGELGVPATLQSLLAARLDALSPAARSLLADAAVLGGSFPAEALVSVSDQQEGDVRRLLDELVRREVLGVRADPLSPERGHYGFVQMMFRQVAYDTLSRRERKVRHLAVADHLQAAFADGGEEIAEVIAAHLLDALKAVSDAPDVPEIRERALAMLTRAGERAERTGAPGPAATAYSTAADLLELIGTPEADLSAAGLHQRSGLAASLTGRAGVAVESHRLAAEIYRRHGRTRDAARASLREAMALRGAGQLDDARALLAGATAVLRSEPDQYTIDALHSSAVLEYYSGNLLVADPLTAEALTLAQALDVPDTTLSELLGTRGLGHAMANRPVQATAYWREALRRAEISRSSGHIGTALGNLADLLLTSEPPAAVEAARSAITHARRIGDRPAWSDGLCNLMQASLLTGDWDEIERAYSTAIEQEQAGEDPVLAYGVVLLRAFRHDLAGLEVVLPTIGQWRSAEQTQDLAESATALAAAATAMGDRLGALDHAWRALAFADVLGLRHDGIRWAWAIAADVALALGDRAEVVRLVDWLDGYPTGHLPPVLRAERLRIRARLLAMDDDAAAGSAFAAAVTAFREFGSPYHLAVGLLDHAESLVAVGDADAAVQLAAEAETIAQRLGAEPLLDRARRMTEAFDGSNPVAVRNL